MTVDQLIEHLMDLSSDGHGQSDVIVQCPTGGMMPMDDVELTNEETEVLLS